MGTMVIVACRPKPGREGDLESLTREHVPILRDLDLATDRPAQAMRAKDGTIVEVFEWRDGALDVAHKHPKVHELWARYAEVCDYVPLQELAETKDLFASFTPIEL
jgi:hypothetical protein